MLRAFLEKKGRGEGKLGREGFAFIALSEIPGTAYPGIQV